MSVQTDPNKGFCLAFGGTNAREAFIEHGAVLGYKSESTPKEPKEFFAWMARRILEASNSGISWAVAGFPGPVSVRGGVQFVGPLANVPGLSRTEYDLHAMLEEADPAYSDLLDNGFLLEPVNDGDLGGQAAAKLVERDYAGKFNTIGNLIVGTGLGAAVVHRDPDDPEIFRPSGMPVEIGHVMEGNYPDETYENYYSGPALQQRRGIAPEHLPKDSPVWREVARGVGKCATALSLMTGAEAVVPSGGVAGNGYDFYRSHLQAFFERYHEGGNGTQLKFVPEIVRIPNDELDTFELNGAEGHMRHLISSAI